MLCRDCHIDQAKSAGTDKPSARITDVLFSTDYPHWQFDGEDVLPGGLSADLVRKIMIDNPYATYGRLQQVARETTP